MLSLEFQKSDAPNFEVFSKLETSELEILLEKLRQLLARRQQPRPAERELQLLKIIYENTQLKNINSPLRLESPDLLQIRRILTKIGEHPPMD